MIYVAVLLGLTLGLCAGIIGFGAYRALNDARKYYGLTWRAFMRLTWGKLR